MMLAMPFYILHRSRESAMALKLTANCPVSSLFTTFPPILCWHFPETIHILKGLDISEIQYKSTTERTAEKEPPSRCPRTAGTVLGQFFNRVWKNMALYR